MDVCITIRQIGKKRAAMQSVPYALRESPSTLRHLLSALSRSGAEGYNARLMPGAEQARPLTGQQLEEMEAIGKLAFGMVYGEKRADPEKAATDAVQAFTDGLFRVFQGQRELTELDAPLIVDDGDEFTFIRLTMLAGSIW